MLRRRFPHGFLMMRQLWILAAFVILPATSGLIHPITKPSLQVKFDVRGLERLSFGEETLVDLSQQPDDGFHIWHMSMADRFGKEVTDGDHGWGENGSQRKWDLATKTWTYAFTWGEIQTTYVLHDDALDVVMKASNRLGSGLTFKGATVYPLTVHGSASKGSPPMTWTRWTDGVNEPEVLTTAVSGVQVVLSSGEGKASIWLGMKPVKDNGTAMILSTARPDGLSGASEPATRFTLAPGQSSTIKVSVRFVASGADASHIATDAFMGYRRLWPERLNWTDRRIIGTVYLASAGTGDGAHRSGTAGDPRRYLAGANADIRTQQGLAKFQSGVLAQADAIVEHLRRMNGQGALTWDLEGQEYPPNTSYVCSPDQIGHVAPEMDSLITVPGSKYAGMKLDDTYFRIIRESGFRVGVCIRPQRFVLRPDGTASQVPLPDTEVLQELVRKMKFAHDRWGATMFYLDSMVRKDGSALGSELLEQAAAAMPDSLLIPEQSTVRSFRAVSPFASFIFHGDLGTSKEVRAIYPRAFSVNLVNDVDPSQLLIHRKELVDEVRHGDVLMIHADYWQANNNFITEIYREAQKPSK